MPFRKIPHEIKVKAVEEFLDGNDIKTVAQKYGISEKTLKREINKIKNRLPLIIPGGPLDEFKKKLKQLRSRLFGR